MVRQFGQKQKSTAEVVKSSADSISGQPGRKVNLTGAGRATKENSIGLKEEKRRIESKGARDLGRSCQ
jgi:hypothetical protein